MLAFRTARTATALATALALGLLASAGCGGGSSSTPDGGTGGPDARRFDGGTPVADAPPAFTCQGTPVAGTPDLALELVQSGFANPTLALSPRNDPRVFVTQLDGTIHIAGRGEFMAVPGVQDGGEQGLLGLAFHPAFATNGRFFLFYTVSGNALLVDEFTVDPGDPDRGDPESRRPILRLDHTYSNHNGGMLNFGPDGYLYISTGDGGDGCDPEQNGQDPTSPLGKILRIDVDRTDGAKNYAIPTGNPFGTEIYLIGLRNPWRFSIDGDNGDIYIGDVGQSTFEEINIAPAGPGQPGMDFGWDTWEADVCHANRDRGCTQGSFHDTCDTAGVTFPVVKLARDESTSVVGGFVYRGCRMPDYHGTYFYSDFYRGWVRSFVWSGAALTNPRTWDGLTLPGDISAYGLDGQGELLLAEYGSGTIWRVVPAP